MAMLDKKKHLIKLKMNLTNYSLENSVIRGELE